MIRRSRWWHSLALAVLLLWGAPAVAQERDGGADTEVAPVRVDGRELFQLRGISAFPAERRARTVSGRIVSLARDDDVDPASIVARDAGDHWEIVAGDTLLFQLFPEDAALEGAPADVLAEASVERIREAVRDYRADRTSGALWRSLALLLGFSVVLILLLWALLRFRTWLGRTMRERISAQFEGLERKSGAAIHRGHFYGLANALIQGLTLVAAVAIAYAYLSTALGSFPWTRGFALSLLGHVRAPLVTMGSALVDAIPDLVFLLILWVIVRYALRTLKSFFEAIGSGRVRLNNFEREWADPTYRLLRIAVIAFSLVVAYPYIPGSDSAAFKGVSLFLGIIVSLGSTSFIANLIAGIALTYRGVFREGDWVVIGRAEGRVEEIRAQVVRLRTRDNERVSIPSSTILNADVTNLSEQADGRGLVLRCSLGLGYDTDWRQAEALLLAAAAETEGLRTDPAPFVQLRELGDYAVTHVLVAHIDDPGGLPALRTRLHRAVLDQFHGAGVQIMSPAYEADPETPKIPPARDG